MKKVIGSVTVFAYLALTCGVMVNYHYCMDRYDSFRLYQASSDWCTTCGMHTRGHGCCHDEVKIVKLQDDHQTSSFSFSLKNLQPAMFTPSELLSIALGKGEALLNKTDHSPPLISRRDAYLKNCVFRI
jgi:hypothetical protein